MEDDIVFHHSSALKPSLKESQKLARVDFILNEIGPNGFYGNMYDHVHVDKKWFYLTMD